MTEKLQKTQEKELSRELQFRALYDEAEQYRRWTDAEGPHSQRGRFYREIIRRKENEMVDLIEKILSESEDTAPSIEGIWELRITVRPYCTKFDVVLDILEAIEGEHEDVDDFEERIVLGAFQLGEIYSFESEKYRAPRYVREYFAGLPTS